MEKDERETVEKVVKEEKEETEGVRILLTPREKLHIKNISREILKNGQQKQWKLASFYIAAKLLTTKLEKEYPQLKPYNKVYEEMVKET